MWPPGSVSPEPPPRGAGVRAVVGGAPPPPGCPRGGEGTGGTGRGAARLSERDPARPGRVGAAGGGGGNVRGSRIFVLLISNALEGSSAIAR